MIRRFLSRRRKGAMAMVALAGMVPVTAMLAANINTSQMVDDRRQVQDASDALATMHGAWSARALNIISMNNVTSAQLMSVAVGSEALYLTTSELTAFAVAAGTYITGHGAFHCPPRTLGPAALVEAVIWTAPCTAWHAGVAVPATLAATRAADINSDFNPRHGIETAKKALAAIDGMNKALARRHPRAMAEIAEDYRVLLDIDDHHFADPCDGPVPNNTCRRTNTGDGMALPLEEAEEDARIQLMAHMRLGSTTTFIERGFSFGEGPLSHGGSRTNPSLDAHINNITQIGTALYDFKRFYSSPISDLPRHPFTGPGTAIGSGYTSPGQPDDEETPFEDRTKDTLDTLKEALEDIDDVTQDVLRVLRQLPLNYDRHPTFANLQGTQNRSCSYTVPDPRTAFQCNSFYRNFLVLYGLILQPDVRARTPLDFGALIGAGVTASPVPETYQLIDISPLNPLPPVEPRTMPDAFHILSYALKDKSRRLSETVISTSVDTHTGYGQTGVFNPDGASLFTQNWQSKLMPATRLDDVRQASRDLARQARDGFDDLAGTLQQVRSTGSWGRVNAH